MAPTCWIKSKRPLKVRDYPPGISNRAMADYPTRSVTADAFVAFEHLDPEQAMADSELIVMLPKSGMVAGEGASMSPSSDPAPAPEEAPSVSSGTGRRRRRKRED